MKKNRIEEYFKHKGFTSAKAFAKALGVSDSHITEIDSRKKNTTLVNALRSKTEFNDCNIDWVLTGAGEMVLKTLVSERPENYRSHKGIVAVTNIVRPVSEDGWELLECYDALCENQRKLLLGVAKAMMLGLPTKSPANDPEETSLLAVNLK